VLFTDKHIYKKRGTRRRRRRRRRRRDREE
jgi:hypothetical protein